MYQILSLIQEDEIFLNTAYQIQYSKNFGLLNAKYQYLLPSKISFNPIKKKLFSSEKTTNSIEEIYCFLCALAFYEINSHRIFEEFVRNLFFII